MRESPSPTGQGPGGGSTGASRRRKEDCSTSPAGQHKGAASLTCSTATGEMAAHSAGGSAGGAYGNASGGHGDPDTCRGARGTYRGAASGHSRLRRASGAEEAGEARRASGAEGAGRPAELKEPEESGKPAELKKPGEPEEDPGWDEWPPDGNNRPCPPARIGHIGMAQRTRRKRMPRLHC